MVAGYDRAILSIMSTGSLLRDLNTRVHDGLSRSPLGVFLTGLHIFRIAALFLLQPIAAHAQPALHDARSDSLLDRFAPVLHHAVDPRGDHSLNGRADLLAAVDFDGDWNARNNWENLETNSVAPVVYTSHVETETHHYLLYTFFHPRDWTNRWFSPTLLDSEHENDCEVFLCVISKDDGDIVAGLTVFHDDLHVLLPSGALVHARSKGDSRLLHLSEYAGSQRPVLFQEARGHGLTAWPMGLQSGQRIVYYPRTRSGASIPTVESNSVENVRYELVSLFANEGWWSHRNDPEMFAAPGRIAGDDEGGCGEGFRACQHDRAQAPWGMKLAGLDAGTIAFDPARLISKVVVPFIGNPGPFDSGYAANPFRASGDLSD